MTIKYEVGDYIGLDGVTYNVNIRVTYDKRFKHGDFYKRKEIRQRIVNRLNQEIDFSSINSTIEQIIIDEVKT